MRAAGDRSSIDAIVCTLAIALFTIFAAADYFSPGVQLVYLQIVPVLLLARSLPLAPALCACVVIAATTVWLGLAGDDYRRAGDVIFNGTLVALTFAIIVLMTRRYLELAAVYEVNGRIFQRLRQAFEPKYLPQRGGIRFDAVYVPAEEESQVGGDWYEASVLKDGRVLLCIGDVMGHGVDAAIVMVRLRQSIAAVAAIERSPAAVLADVNSFMAAQEQIATAIVGFIDPGTQVFSYAIAGHPSPLLIAPDGGGSPFSDEHDLPLGVQPDAEFHDRAIALTHGTTLLLFSDGLLEFRRDIIQTERDVRRLAASMAAEPIEGFARRLYTGITQGRNARDDVAILAARVVTPR